MSNKLPTILEPEEASALLRIPNKRYPTGLRNKAVLSVMLNMGLRLNEVCNLKPGDLTLTKSKLKIVNGKGNKDRILFINDNVLALIEEWRKIRPKSEWFFCTLEGHRLSDKYLQALVPRYAKKAGIEKKISPHTLRHTYATDYYRQTKDIQTLRLILGHSNIATTTIYINLAGIDVENGMKAFKAFV
jgi:integrase/recombinase XerD